MECKLSIKFLAEYYLASLSVNSFLLRKLKAAEIMLLPAYTKNSWLLLKISSIIFSFPTSNVSFWKSSFLRMIVKSKSCSRTWSLGSRKIPKSCPCLRTCFDWLLVMWRVYVSSYSPSELSSGRTGCEIFAIFSSGLMSRDPVLELWMRDLTLMGLRLMRCSFIN